MEQPNTRGYGEYYIGNYRFERAHRFSYKIYKGKIPKGLCVCHTCDNPKCVNPDHLWLGTVKENNQDCIKKKDININHIQEKKILERNLLKKK